MTTKARRPIAALAALLVALSLALPGARAMAYESSENIVAGGHGYNNAQYLVVHETANPGASAWNHVIYWGNNPDYAVHYVMELDGSTVYRTMYDDRLAWHVGNGNYQTVGIELAHATNQVDFDRQWAEAVRWCGDYLAGRGWGVDRLLSHDECRRIWGGTDHTDPTGYFAAYGRTWAQFEGCVAEYMASGSVVTPGTSGTGGSSNVSEEVRYRSSSDPSGTYWLPEMVDRYDTGGSGDTYAGDGQPMRWLAIDMPGWYQVRTQANGWLDPVSGYDTGDLMYGCRSYEIGNILHTGLKVHVPVATLPAGDVTKLLLRHARPGLDRLARRGVRGGKPGRGLHGQDARPCRHVRVGRRLRRQRRHHHGLLGRPGSRVTAGGVARPVARFQLGAA